MSTISICYGTTDGQTADVAEFIAGVIRDRGKPQYRSVSG